MGKNHTMPGLSDEEWKTWAELTKRIRFENDKIPEGAFYAFCESFISPVVDVVPYRIKNKEIEILLIYRKDKYYDGFHLPGSVIVPGRTSIETLNLVIDKELGREARVTKKTFVKVVDTLKGDGPGLDTRGQDLKLLYACEVSGQTMDGEWFTLKELPVKIIPEHREVVIEMFEWITNSL